MLEKYAQFMRDEEVIECTGLSYRTSKGLMVHLFKYIKHGADTDKDDFLIKEEKELEGFGWKKIVPVTYPLLEEISEEIGRNPAFLRELVEFINGKHGG